MNLTGRIRNNETGEIRELAGHWIENWQSNEALQYMFRSGNYSCDCNRWIMFTKDEDCPEQLECSDYIFDVEIKDGNEFLLTFDDNRE